MHKLFIIKNIVWGFFLTRKIQEKKAIFCSSGLGDTFYTLLFIDEYVVKNKEENITVFISDKQKDIVEICKPQYITVKLYKGEYKPAFHYFLTLANRVNGNYRFLNLEPAILGKKLKKYIEKHNFEQVFYYDLLKLKGDMPFKLIPDDEVWQENKVLIIPDSNSIITFSAEFWCNLINTLRDRFNFSVYVNKSTNQIINQEKEIYCYEKSVLDLYREAGTFRFIISIRNGICDIVAKQRCRLIVLYPGEYSDPKKLKMYSLKDIKRSCEVKEIVIKDEKRNLSQEEIVNSCQLMLR